MICHRSPYTEFTCNCNFWYRTYSSYANYWAWSDAFIMGYYYLWCASI